MITKELMIGEKGTTGNPGNGHWFISPILIVLAGAADNYHFSAIFFP